MSLTVPVRAQGPARRIATAVHISAAPVIDGVLEEQVWRDAPVLTDFTQAEPAEGAPASESTEVRLLYDDDAIYVGAVMHDSDPSRIVRTDIRRDTGVGDSDSFTVVFDTFADEQNGFHIGTNTGGVQYDAQIRNQGPGDTTWDGTWEVKTKMTSTGWTAEFRIPLRTLRYGPAPQTWGFNAFRKIERHRERSYWAPIPRPYTLSRLSLAGELRGLNLQTPRNFKLLPWVVSTANKDFIAASRTDVLADAGLDAKFGVTPSLNLDVTVNTDFAQVEVDTQQINLTRFNLRFPEKRPFFLENAGLFKVGKGDEVDLFFSRRIGLDENGNLVPIIAGGRLSGKAGGTNLGVLNMQTGTAGVRPGDNFSVVRASRELPNRSHVGAMFLNRNAIDSARSGDWNRTFGVDGKIGIGRPFEASAFAAHTETPGRRGRDYAYNIDTTYDDGRHRIDGQWGLTGEDFNPELGFIEREGGYRRWYVQFEETMRQRWVRDLGFREWLPHIQYTRFDYLDGGLNNAELHLDNHWDWESGYRIDTALNGTWEGLRVPFRIYPGVIVPPGEYGGLRFGTKWYTDKRRALSANGSWDVGRFLTGNQNSSTAQITLRSSSRFNVTTNWSHRIIDLPEGRFHTNLGNMRVAYNFSPYVFVQSLVQYNDRTDRWSSNLRFHWLDTAGTGLFVVYNDAESLDGMGPVNRAFIVKYVKQFDVLR